MSKKERRKKKEVLSGWFKDTWDSEQNNRRDALIIFGAIILILYAKARGWI